jgi:hypothetical protein
MRFEHFSKDFLPFDCIMRAILGFLPKQKAMHIPSQKRGANFIMKLDKTR